jgi:hypothetical protein
MRIEMLSALLHSLRSQYSRPECGTSPHSVLNDQMLHPYTEWCPGLTLDFYGMESACGIAHIPYEAEIAHRPLPDNLTPGAAAKKAPHPMVDNIRTVQRLHELGALNNQEMQSVLELKAIVDEQIKIASAEKERIPFAVGHRVIQTYLNRWASISKALEFVGKPYNPYGKLVNNLPLTTEEGDDKKRKAPRSLSGMTTDEVDDTVKEKSPPQQQAEGNDMDHQSPEGSGGAATQSKAPKPKLSKFLILL